MNEIHYSFNNNKSIEVRSVFMDISKAFDKVWHEGLLFKLRQNGVEEPLLNLLTSYLANRKQRVVLNGTSSEWKSTSFGVLQGSTLGPLIFNLHK